MTQPTNMEIPEVEKAKKKEVNIIHIIVLAAVICLTIAVCFLLFWIKTTAESKVAFGPYVVAVFFLFVPICFFSAVYGGWNLKSMWYLPLIPIFIHYMLSPVWNGSMRYEAVIPIEIGIMLITAGVKVCIRKWKQHAAARRTQ